MSQAELDDIPHRLLYQIRFAKWAIAKMQATWLYAKILAENRSKYTPPDNEVPTILFKMEVFSFETLIIGEGLCQLR